MIAELHDRITAAEASIRTLRALRPWIIAGTIASIIGTILKILPIHPQGNELLTPPSPATNTNSLHIGTTATPDAESRAAWLTTEDVARREKKSPRTILTWITEGRILRHGARSLGVAEDELVKIAVRTLGLGELAAMRLAHDLATLGRCFEVVMGDLGQVILAIALFQGHSAASVECYACPRGQIFVDGVSNQGVREPKTTRKSRGGGHDLEGQCRCEPFQEGGPRSLAGHLEKR